jgi:hypothetical protein
MQRKKSLPGAETGADARGGGQLRWKASRYSPLRISGSSPPFLFSLSFPVSVASRYYEKGGELLVTV